MKRPAEADIQGPRKSSKTSYSDSESSDTNSTSKKVRKQAEAKRDAEVTHVKSSEVIRLQNEALARSRLQAQQWTEQNLPSKQKIEKSPAKATHSAPAKPILSAPAKPIHTAPKAEAKSEPSEAPKIRKSVIPSVPKEAPAHRVVEYFEAERSRVAPVYDIPLIKIQHPKFKMVENPAAIQGSQASTTRSSTSRLEKIALGMPFIGMLGFYVANKVPFTPTIYSCPTEAFVSLAFIGLLHLCSH